MILPPALGNLFLYRHQHRGRMANLSRLEDRADLQISLVLMASWAAITITANWGNWPPDLSALFLAGHFWSSGQYDLVYAAPDGFFGPGVQSWADELARLGHGGETFFPFVYPPIWAALAAPLAQTLGPTGFFNTFYVIHILMIAASVLLAYRVVRPPVPLVLWCVLSCALLYLSLIAVSAIYHNQLQIMVTFLIILSLERYSSGASITAGIALGLAAAIKISPAALGLIFLLDRDIRAAVATAVTGGLLLALSLLIAGPELHQEFLARVREISSQIAVMHVNWNIEAYLLQLHALVTGTPLHGPQAIDNFATPEPLWVTIATKVILVAGVALVVARTRGLPRQDALRIRPLGLMMVLTLCGPLGWSHHYLTILILLPGVLTFLQPIRAVAILVIIAGLTSLGVFSLVKPLGVQVHAQALFCTTVLLAIFALFFARPLQFHVVQRTSPSRRKSRRQPSR